MAVLSLPAQKAAIPPLKVVFYNLENLYDTVDDPNKNDNEFLPGSEKDWNSARYLEKIANLGRVLSFIDNSELPGVIGLCEAENREVLEDLVRLTPLSAAPYRIILEEGEDPRSIDVALMYRSDRLTYLDHKPFRASAENQTRFILYVKLLGSAGDTLHFFVNHWKSRSGGVRETEPKRIEAAGLLRHAVDSLFAMNPEARILILGDLNDEPADKSVALTLEALEPGKDPQPGELYNLFLADWKAGKGTLWYRDWDLFDQIIVSGSLLTKSRERYPYIRTARGTIFNPLWLLVSWDGEPSTPFRSYTYKRGYTGGYSDHLPVYVSLQ